MTSSPHHFASRLLILALTASSAPLWADPQARRVGDPGLGSDPSFYKEGQFSPDGKWLVLRSDPEAPDAFELYSTPRHGGPVVRISFPLVAGQLVSTWTITPDSRRVVYLVGQETFGIPELWSVPIEGPAGASVKLSPPLASGDSVVDFATSPVGSRVVFRTRIGGVYSLWSAPTAGPAGSAVKLSPSSPRDVRGFRLAADGQGVVFHGDLTTAGKVELWSVPIDGPAGASVRLTTTPVGSGVTDYLLAPDGSRVIYRGSVGTAVDELWSVPIGGPGAAAVKLSPTPVAGGAVFSEFEVSPDGSRVVFRGTLLDAQFPELWSVPTAGPALDATRLNNPPPPGGYVHGSFAISGNGTRVIFRGNLSLGAQRTELWSAPIDGSSGAIRLHSAAVLGGNVFSFQIAPDDSRVVFHGDIETDGLFELWSTPLAGPAASAVKLSGAQVSGGSVGSYRVSPDSSRVVFRGNLTFESRSWLYSTPISGGSRTTLTSFFLSPGSVMEDWTITGDGRFVVYRSNFAITTRTDLSRVPITGPPRQVLSPSMGDDRTVRSSYRISPDSLGVFYWVDVDVATIYEPWIADESVFFDGFESGTTSHWSATVP